MSTNNSKGGYIRPPREQKNVNILLIGSHASDADFMKQELGMITALSYTASYCVDLAEALDFISDGEFKVEMIIIDLSLFNADYPKERFLQIRKNIPDIPIIVLTDQTDYDLMHFVMEEGAAETISHWQVRTDPDRLRNVVESCCSRDKITRIERRAVADLMLDAARKSADALNDEKERSEALLHQVQNQDALALGIVNAENQQLRIDISQSTANLLEARHKGASDLQDANDRSSSILSLAQDESKTALQAARDLSMQLKEDLYRGNVELLRSNQQSEALLKYTQESSALDLKLAKDETSELRLELNQLKAWMSGSYSI